MNRIGKIVFFLLVTFFGCSSSKRTITQPKIDIAVMDIEARTGVQPREAQSVGDFFVSQLQKTGRFNVLDRKHVNTIIHEQGFQASQGGNASKTGKVLAVHKMLFGSLGKLGKSVYVLSIKMTDVESSSIDLAISKNYEDDLRDIGDEFLPDIVNEIVRCVDGGMK